VHKPTRILAKSAPVQLGVDGAQLSFVRPDPAKPGQTGDRRLRLDGVDAFDLSFWCGTCPLLFERLGGANETLSNDKMQSLLNRGLTSIDRKVIKAASKILPKGRYLPMLLSVDPILVMPFSEGDYFANEQVVHRGVEPFWGMPHNAHTPYYRGGTWQVEHESLFEFIVPMVPPTWNESSRVDEYEARFKNGESQTVLALAVVDRTQPSDSFDAHSGLMHFVLDGHHKLEAAARVGSPVTLLSLLAVDDSMVGGDDLERLIGMIATDEVL